MYIYIYIWLLAGGPCSRTGPTKTLCQPCAGGGSDLVPEGGSDLVPGRGARPCAGYLCEDLCRVLLP